MEQSEVFRWHHRSAVRSSEMLIEGDRLRSTQKAATVGSGNYPELFGKTSQKLVLLQNSKINPIVLYLNYQ